MKQKTNTHALRRRILIILCGLLIVLGALAAWQRENIKAIINAQRYSKAEIATQLADNEEKLKQSIHSVPGVKIREPTDDEVAQLKSGMIDEQTFINRLMNYVTDDANEGDDTARNGPTKSSVEEHAASAAATTAPGYQEQLDRLIAQTYALRAVFVGQLDSLLSQAQREHGAIPKAKRTAQVKSSLVAKYMGRAGGLEQECDARMDQIIAQVRQVLKENNISSSLPQEMAYAYANEKSLRKSYYLSYKN